jgi:hypothetical protein
MSRTFNGGKALLIGIGEGYSPGLRLPRDVRADAEALGRVLEDPALCGYPKANVLVLLDDCATRENILAGLRRLVTTATSNDTVLIFFSGHGGRTTTPGSDASFICPADFDVSLPESTGIGADELSSIVSEIPALRVIVILDACHADGAAFLKALEIEKKIEFRLKDAALDKLCTGSGRIVLSSCKDDERSQTYPSKGHSLFSYFLLEGLRGKAIDRGDGLVHVLDLFHYVSEQVPLNVSAGHQQHPVLKVHAENNFPLALRVGGYVKNIATPSPQENLTCDLAKLEKVFTQLYPSGPQHNELWSRSGGDVAALLPGGSGRAAWHSAIRTIALGGGGTALSFNSLIETGMVDFPKSEDLKGLQR